MNTLDLVSLFSEEDVEPQKAVARSKVNMSIPNPSTINIIDSNESSN